MGVRSWKYNRVRLSRLCQRGFLFFSIVMPSCSHLHPSPGGFSLRLPRGIYIIQRGSCSRLKQPLARSRPFGNEGLIYLKLEILLLRRQNFPGENEVYFPEDAQLCTAWLITLQNLIKCTGGCNVYYHRNIHRCPLDLKSLAPARTVRSAVEPTLAGSSKGSLLPERLKSLDFHR